MCILMACFIYRTDDIRSERVNKGILRRKLISKIENSSAPAYTIIILYIRSSYDLHIVQSRDKTMHNLERHSEETRFGSQGMS